MKRRRQIVPRHNYTYTYTYMKRNPNLTTLWRHVHQQKHTDLLQEHGDSWDHLGAVVFQREHRLWRLDEQLGFAVLHVVLVVVLAQNHLTTLTLVAAPEVGPRVLRHHLVSAADE